MPNGVILLLAALLAQPAEEPVAPPLVIAPSDPPEGMPKEIEPAARVAGLELAKFLYPESQQLAAAAHLFETSLEPLFRGDPNFQELESAYPGFIEAVITEIRPIMERDTREFLPEYHRRTADIFATYLTAAEIADLKQFYETPTGRKILRGMRDNYRLDSVMSEIANDADAPTSYFSVSKDHQKAVVATKKLIDESDHDALIAIAKKPYAKRVLAAGAAIRRFDHQLLNEPDPELEQQIGAAFDAVFDRMEAAAAAAERQ